MDIIIDSVNKLKEILEHSGCEDGGVLLEVNADAVNCRYEKGACMSASFGGKTAEFVTYDPIRAQTKISFMFDAPLDTPPVRGAACAIVNVTTGFFCLSRVLHACPASSHKACMNLLTKEIAGKKITCIGSMQTIVAAGGDLNVANPPDAEIILINGDGIIAQGTGNLVTDKKERQRIICLGPSTSGVARLQHLEHWCPFGTGT